MTTLNIEAKLAIIDYYDRNPEQVLNMLVDLQYASPKGYIDEPTAQLVAKELGLTETRVYEMISYYSILKDEKQARYVMKICDSAPCHFSGEQVVSETLAKVLGVPANTATPDGLFLYHSVPCIGLCDKAPFIKIKDRVFTNLNEEEISQLVVDLAEGEYPEL